MVEPPESSLRPAPPVGQESDEGPDLAVAVEVARAGRDYWRHVADQRRQQAARIQRRPLVRVAVAVDRRTAPAQDVMAQVTGRASRALRRVSLSVGGWRRLPDRARRRDELATWIGGIPNCLDDRPVLVVHLGPAPPVRADRDITLIDVCGDGEEASMAIAQRINAAVSTTTALLVVLLGPDSRPVEGSWLDHLTAPLGAEVVATAPVTIHPDRSWASGTPHDLLVRHAGLELLIGPDGAPLPRAGSAGLGPADVDPGPTVSATAAGIAVDRRAWSDVGGLTPPAPGDLDAAVADLCIRLGRAGGRIEVAPHALVVDRRPVLHRSDLATPLAEDGAPWRSVVDLHGAALARLATGPARLDAPSTVTITTATPSRKLAPRSGDWLYARLFADALRRAGHRVRVQTAEEADSPAGRVADVHIVLRGLEPVRRTLGQHHVLWVISHPDALDADECERADLVLVASERGAATMRRQSTTPVEVLLQATEPRFFRPRPVAAAHRHAVTVVASSRGVQRAAVTDSVAAGLHPAVYGQGWEGLIDPGLVVADYAEEQDLPVVYSSAEVVLNDHWATMRHEGLVSNRIFDVLACGTAVVSDHLPEVEDLFGDLVPMWRTPDELGAIVAAIRSDPAGAAARTADARAVVLDAHTFDHRVTRLMHLLAHHGLGPPLPEEA